jgi:hypothetical protein
MECECLKDDDGNNGAMTFGQLDKETLAEG